LMVLIKLWFAKQPEDKHKRLIVLPPFADSKRGFYFKKTEIHTY